MSGVTDPYQPVERRLKLTRRCLRSAGEISQSVGIITKNHLVTRDIDVLARAGRARCRCRQRFRHFAGSETAAHSRAADIDSAGALRSDSRNCAPRNSGRRNGCADHSRLNGSRSSGDY